MKEIAAGLVLASMGIVAKWCKKHRQTNKSSVDMGWEVIISSCLVWMIPRLGDLEAALSLPKDGRHIHFEGTDRV